MIAVEYKTTEHGTVRVFDVAISSDELMVNPESDYIHNDDIAKIIKTALEEHFRNRLKLLKENYEKSWG